MSRYNNRGSLGVLAMKVLLVVMIMVVVERMMVMESTKRIHPARGWFASRGGGRGTVQIVFIYPASLDTRPPSFLGETSCASRRMAGGAPTTYGRHWDVFQKKWCLC